jgi:predicted ATPase
LSTSRAGDAEDAVRLLADAVDVRGSDRASRSASVELFLERARAARPGFEPDAEDLAFVAEVCRRVDGLPLAIDARGDTASADELRLRANVALT